MEARNANGTTPLLAAATTDAEKTKLLIDAGANIEARDKDGWTPLHKAANAGQAEAAIALLDSGADGKARTTDGKTPYDLAPEKLNGTNALKRLRAAQSD